MATDLIESEFVNDDSGLPPALRGGHALQQVKASYTTAVAVQKPRSIEGVSKSLIRESQLAGECFYYGWSAGGERIEGASIGLAMAAARCWGNCAVEQLPVQETPNSWIFTATFVDLETGCTVARQFRQSKKSKVAGKHDEERKDDIRFQIGQSKATRNVVLNALPRWLIDQAKEAAMEGVRTKIEQYIAKNGMAAAVDYVVKALLKAGVPEAAITDKFDIAAVTGLTIDHLVVLKGDLSAIQNGQERAESLFPAMQPESTRGGRVSPLNEKLNAKAPEEPMPDVDAVNAYKDSLEMAVANGDLAAIARIDDEACGPESVLNATQISIVEKLVKKAKDQLNKGKASGDLFPKNENTGQ